MRSLVFHFLLVGLALPALAGSQLDGRFYLSKRTYSAGEPVFRLSKWKTKGNSLSRLALLTLSASAEATRLRWKEPRVGSHSAATVV